MSTGNAASRLEPGDIPSTGRAWLAAIRPATLSASGVPVLVGSALAMADQRFVPGPALAALAGAALIQIGTNLHNDLADFERGADTEQRIGPPRAVQQGWLEPRQMRSAAWLSLGLATLAGVYLVAVAGWPVVAIGTASLACAVGYTGGPFPLAYRGLGDLFVMVFFGLIAVCGSYFVQALSCTPAAVWASLLVGALATAILVVNNLRDRFTDAQAGKRTLAVRLGARLTRIEYSLLVLLPYASLPLAWLSGIGHGGWLLPLLSLPLALSVTLDVWRLDGADLNPILGRSARLQLVFGILLAVGVLP